MPSACPPRSKTSSATTTPDSGDCRMSSSSRITRPHPTRSEPIRGFAASPPPAATSGTPGKAPKAVGEAVAEAVDLGYRVLDEYLRQGQNAARRFGVRPERAEAAVDDMQALATRMARYTSDFLGVWAQFVEVALSAGGLGAAVGAPPSSNGHAAKPPPANGVPARPTVAVRIASVQPAEVSTEIAPDMVGRPLTVQDLRSADPAAPPMGGVRLEPATATEPARLLVTVPAT